MADFQQLDANLLVTGQINLDDIQTASDAGIKMIICNRPDEEEGDHPRSESLDALLKTYGIEFRYIPVSPGQITRENVVATKKAFDDAQGPILAYCRSGKRSTVMWAVVQAALDRMTNNEIINKAGSLGHDLNPMAMAFNSVREADLSS